MFFVGCSHECVGYPASNPPPINFYYNNNFCHGQFNYSSIKGERLGLYKLLLSQVTNNNYLQQEGNT